MDNFNIINTNKPFNAVLKSSNEFNTEINSGIIQSYTPMINSETEPTEIVHTVKELIDGILNVSSENYISNNGKVFLSYEELCNYNGQIFNDDKAFIVGSTENGSIFYDKYRVDMSVSPVWVKQCRIINTFFNQDQWNVIATEIHNALDGDVNN